MKRFSSLRKKKINRIFTYGNFMGNVISQLLLVVLDGTINNTSNVYSRFSATVDFSQYC